MNSYGIVHMKNKHIDKVDNGYFLKWCTLLNGNRIKIRTKKHIDICDYFYEILYIEKDSKYVLGNKLGTVGLEMDERLFLEYRNNIKWKKLSPKIINNSLYQGDPYKDIRIDLSMEHSISIDPEGCTDIDDCLHINKNENGITTLGIHIADVASYIKEDSELDSKISERCESKYFPWKTHHMLGHNLSTKICSLRKVKNGEKKKRAFSLILKFDINNNIISTEFKKTYIINKRELSYKRAVILMEEENYTGKKIKELYNLGKIIIKNFKLESILSCNGVIIHYDIHKMIEVYMLVINILVAKKLKKEYPKYAILRKQDKFREPLLNYDDSNDLKLINEINKYKMERAIYITSDLKNTYHFGLNMECYTHFSSPIRRYIDIINHRMLSSLLMNKKYNSIKDHSIICDNVNTTKKNLNKAYREAGLLNIFYTYYKEGGIHNFTGNIIGIHDESLIIFINIKNNVNLNLKYNIFNKKNKHLYDIKESDENKIIFFDKEQEVNVTYKLFQKINVKIIFTKNNGLFNNKFNLQII
jgi:exoribonuclease R